MEIHMFREWSMAVELKMCLCVFLCVHEETEGVGMEIRVVCVYTCNCVGETDGCRKRQDEWEAEMGVCGMIQMCGFCYTEKRVCVKTESWLCGERCKTVCQAIGLSVRRKSQRSVGHKSEVHVWRDRKA